MCPGTRVAKAISPRAAHGAVFGHEQASSARHSFQRTEESSAPAKLGVRLHLDGAAHPGKLSGFGDHGLVRLQGELENRHGGADNTALHGKSLLK